MYEVEYFCGGQWRTYSTTGNMSAAMSMADRLSSKYDAVRVLEEGSVVYCA